jgi:predicted Zn-dependent peptidase
MDMAYEYIQNKLSGTAQVKQVDRSKYSMADELVKLKELLDLEAITKEEFDSKKKQLLEDKKEAIPVNKQEEK